MPCQGPESKNLGFRPLGLCPNYNTLSLPVRDDTYTGAHRCVTAWLAKTDTGLASAVRAELLQTRGWPGKKSQYQDQAHPEAIAGLKANEKCSPCRRPHVK